MFGRERLAQLRVPDHAANHSLAHWAAGHSEGRVGLYMRTLMLSAMLPALAHLSVLLFPKPRCCVISFVYDCTVLLLYLGTRELRLELKKEWWSTQDLQRFLQVFGQGSARDTSQSWVSPCSKQNAGVYFFDEAFKMLVQSPSPVYLIKEPGSIYFQQQKNALFMQMWKWLLCFMKCSALIINYGACTHMHIHKS